MPGCASAAVVVRARAKAPKAPDVIRLRFIIVSIRRCLRTKPLLANGYRHQKVG